MQKYAPNRTCESVLDLQPAPQTSLIWISCSDGPGAKLKWMLNEHQQPYLSLSPIHLCEHISAVILHY